MNMKIFLHLALAQAVLVTTVNANVVALGASKDNTLYQPASGGTTNSNGAGNSFFVGRTDNAYLRRGLIAFDEIGRAHV